MFKTFVIWTLWYTFNGVPTSLADWDLLAEKWFGNACHQAVKEYRQDIGRYDNVKFDMFECEEILIYYPK